MQDDLKFVISVDDRDLIRAQKEQLKLQRNLTTIEGAFRSGKITAARYNSELARQTKGLSALGGNYRRASSEVRTYAYSLRNATDAQLAHARATSMAGKSTNRFGMYAQQVGYQVGDFFVQVQSGTSALVAFGQQGTQLAGLLPGLTGAVIGISLAVGTMLLRTLQQSKEAMDGTAAAAKKLKGQLESLDKTLRDWAETKEAVSKGMTVEELIGTKGVEEATKELEKAKKTLSDIIKANKASQLTGGSFIFGFGTAKKVDKALAAVKKAEERLAAVQAKVRQEAREKAEKILLEGLAEDQRARALAEWETGQEVIAARKVWVNEAIGIFRDAQKRMRDEDMAETERSLDRLFRNRTLMYSIRFSGESDVMSQSVSAAKGKMKPSQSYGELLSMGWSADDLERMGVNKPKGKGGGTSPAETLDKYLKAAEKEVKLRRKQVGLSEEASRVMELRTKYEEAGIEVNMQRINALVAEEEALRKATEAEEARASLLQSFEDNFSSAMEDLVTGSKSVSEAFRSMMHEMVLEIWRQQAMKPMASATGTWISGLLGGLFGSANGNAFSGGRHLQAFADGGVVSGPTMFPMASGTGLMGEAGPEAIMPLKRGANGKLGVQMEGDQGGVVINNNFNFVANGDDSVKKIIATSMPDITKSVKSSVIDSRRRGGAFRKTFG